MYGCYDPRNVWEYTFRCGGCGKKISPKNGYKTTHGSPGFIFFCPEECSHLTFAYRLDKGQSLVK